MLSRPDHRLSKRSTCRASEKFATIRRRAARPISALSRGIREQPFEGIRHCRRVARRREQTGHAVFDQLGNAADARSDRRHFARARFHQAHRHALAVTGQDRDRRRAAAM